MSSSPESRPPLPIVRLLPRKHRRFKSGHPWIYANEIEMTPELKHLPAGELVAVANSGGDLLGTALFNPRSLIVARGISNEPGQLFDRELISQRLEEALSLRERLFDTPYYRLVHAEADRLPGLIVDRYGDVVVCQANTAGVERVEGELLECLDELIRPRAVVMRNDSQVRALEGLEADVRLARGSVVGPVEVRENGSVFLTDITGGQKTGWFFDQRDNRSHMARLSRSARVLDLYSYLGGFGIQAAAAGADHVTLVDRSEQALSLAERSADLNGVSARCSFVRASAFEEMARLGKAGERFDVVIVDPPAFVRSRKDLAAGLRGYRKMVRLAAGLVRAKGFLFAASCSHHASPELFAEQVRHGLADAGRNGRILRRTGAGPDHPVHPFLPESAYLKAEVLQLD